MPVVVIPTSGIYSASAFNRQRRCAHGPPVQRTCNPSRTSKHGSIPPHSYHRSAAICLFFARAPCSLPEARTIHATTQCPAGAEALALDWDLGSSPPGFQPLDAPRLPDPELSSALLAAGPSDPKGEEGLLSLFPQLARPRAPRMGSLGSRIGCCKLRLVWPPPQPRWQRVELQQRPAWSSLSPPLRRKRLRSGHR